MLHHIDKEKGKKYTFIVKSNWTDCIVEYDNIFSNDVYQKYKSRLNGVEGELIVCTNLNKLDGFCKKIVQETYQEYQEFILSRDFTKEQWVYNILDGIAEQNEILYHDDLVVIAPNYTWDSLDLSKMYLLLFPTDKSLHSIRDLNSTHINLLEHAKSKTLEIIADKYGFDSSIIKMYLHYAPTTYHLHIHFVLISNTDANSSVEYSHDLNTVITNLKIKSDYYQSVMLNKRI